MENESAALETGGMGHNNSFISSIVFSLSLEPEMKSKTDFPLIAQPYSVCKGCTSYKTRACIYQAYITLKDTAKKWKKRMDQSLNRFL